MSQITIVGGGLAGCSLGWYLKNKGYDFKIIDPCEEVTSTLIAAGIINPITGPSLTKSPRLEELWSIAKDFYHSIEKEAGVKMFRLTQVVRLFDSDRQIERWHRRLLDSEYSALVTEEPLGLSDSFNSEYGGFVTKFGAHLDTRVFIQLLRKLLEDHWVTAHCEEQPLEGTTIYCEGVQGARILFLNGLNLNLQKEKF